MKKVGIKNTEYYQKEFSKLIDNMAYRHGRQAIFSDFLDLAICSFHSTNLRSRLMEKDEANEKKYLSIIGKYGRNDQLIFPQMLACLVNHTADNEYEDIFGDWFMENISNGHNGQFFTPQCVCDLMASINLPEGESGKTVCDPCCGSGRLLLSVAKIAPNNYFYAADNYHDCAKMTAINMFLNGLRGEVAHMDTLSLSWYGAYQINSQGIGIIPLPKENSIFWHDAENRNRQYEEIKQKEIEEALFKKTKGQISMF